jgi:hypothetical protein
MQRALQLVHEVVEIRSSPTTVEILHKGARVASHLRSRERGKAWRWRRKMGPLWQGERGQGCGCAIADCRRKIARFEVVPTRERDENPRNPLCSRLSTRSRRLTVAAVWRIFGEEVCRLSITCGNVCPRRRLKSYACQATLSRDPSGQGCTPRAPEPAWVGPSKKWILQTARSYWPTSQPPDTVIGQGHGRTSRHSR